MLRKGFSSLETKIKIWHNNVGYAIEQNVSLTELNKAHYDLWQCNPAHASLSS